MLRLSLILLMTGLSAAPAAGASTSLSDEDLGPVHAALTPLEEALERGDLDAAERLALDAYLVFEGIEPRIAAFDRSLVGDLESAYGGVRGRAAAGDRAGALRELTRVRELLERAEGAGRAMGTRIAFLNSFGILFREGIEALLLCTALAAAAARRSRALARTIGWGAAAALAASVVTAVLVARVLHIAPAGREAIEGVTMLLAAAVLFYVSYWLLSKLEVARWLGFLKDRIGEGRSHWALFGVAFLAVYREGAETILFYQALGSAAPPGPVVAGFAAAAVALVAVAIAVLRFGMRLPMRPLFAVTGGLLYYLAVVFAGQGVHELQEAGWIGLTPVSGAPRVGWLGLYPTIETLAAQGLLVALAIAAAAVVLRRSRAARQDLPAPAEPASVPPRREAAAR